MSIPNPVNGVPGHSFVSSTCFNTDRKGLTTGYYQHCPRQVYIASRRWEDEHIGVLLDALDVGNPNNFVAWTVDHGPTSPHLHANSAPRTNLRGERYSLFDGGIRVP